MKSELTQVPNKTVRNVGTVVKIDPEMIEYIYAYSAPYLTEL
jgi:hypothetical protein